MVREAIELTKNAINNIGAALEFPVTLVLAQRNEVRNYAIDILKTVNGKRAEIDEMISSALVNWQIDRLAQVDKDILRIATAEMMFMSVASKVAIDEAVELAKRYSSEDGYRFINGVLRRIDDQLKELRKLK
jgi:N utilization substance protein B